MNATAQIHRLHQHRMWVNSQLIASAKLLPPDQLRSKLEIGQGSVWQTLTHLLAAEFVWLETLLGNESPLMPGDVADQLPGNQQGDDAIGSFDELTQCWSALDQRWMEYLNTLTESALDEVVYKVSTSSGAGQRYGTTRSDVLLNVCMHAQYTTAQFVNMLRQLGASEMPDVMLITLSREEQSA